MNHTNLPDDLLFHEIRYKDTISPVFWSEKNAIRYNSVISVYFGMFRPVELVIWRIPPSYHTMMPTALSKSRRVMSISSTCCSKDTGIGSFLICMGSQNQRRFLRSSCWMSSWNFGTEGRPSLRSSTLKPFCSEWPTTKQWTSSGPSAATRLCSSRYGSLWKTCPLLKRPMNTFCSRVPMP